MKIAVIDNYDSFVYNIIHYIESIDGVETKVMKNNEIHWEILNTVDKILLSPGPGIPSEAGSLMRVISEYYYNKPILGVCLGHQAIGEYFGATLKNLSQPLHGLSSMMHKKKEDLLWKEIDFPTQIAHYHSWVVDTVNFPKELEILSIDERDNIMAIRHKKLPIRGVQFHPESILTDFGRKILENWIKS